MKYRVIGQDPQTRREVSVLSLGAMLFGTATDEPTSFAILDRYVEAGGTFVDTSDNYAYWINGTQGGESERLLGRWRRSRGIGDEVVVATKVGARPLAPGTGFLDNAEGLSAKVIRESATFASLASIFKAALWRWLICRRRSTIIPSRGISRSTPARS